VIGFLARRTAISFVLVLLLTAVTFLIYFTIPARAGRILYPPGANVQEEQLDRAEHAMGVDRPLLVQYGDYLWGLLHLDFGTAWNGAEVAPDGKLQGFPVRDALFDSARITGSLVLGGAVLLAVLALPLGLLAALRPNSLLDRTVLVVAIVAISTHPIAVGLVLRFLFANQLDVAPPIGYCPFFTDPEEPWVPDITKPTEACGGAADWTMHLLLPWITFALFFVALYVRMIRGRMIEVLSEPYIRTARAKGAGEWRVLGRHGLRNGIAPVVTMLGMDIGMALGIAVYVESVFGLPGLARLAIFAMSGQAGYDLPMILGVVVLTAVLIVVLNLLVDIVCAVIDPHVREQGRQLVALPGVMRAAP
jgi:peptide/nickel transport system permease protein